ncbi:MAG: restriction endonuclease [Flavisolibacter sp.]|nr:restriction endonuclease [Flavisolibacter sp.]
MIPDYQTLMLPLLKTIYDGKEYEFKKLIEVLAVEFKLNEEEKNELLPSGQALLFPNRVGWARTYLKKAGLIESPGRGIIKITERGKNTLKENLTEINVKYLSKFPEFIQFKLQSRDDDESQLPSLNNEENRKQTPEELLESGYQNIRKSLEEEILSKLKSVTPSFFERIVVQLLVKMGYGGSIKDAGKAIGKSGDEGIDGIIKEDKLGLDVIYIQAKRWEGVVSRPELQKFVGALAGQRAKKGVFITTSNFSKEAITYAAQMDTKIVLIDGEQLAQYMIDYNLGVSVQNTYEIKKIDSDYFEEE